MVGVVRPESYQLALFAAKWTKILGCMPLRPKKNPIDRPFGLILQEALLA
jgi:hypothetical protein